jgi:hypothetical protein
MAYSAREEEIQLRREVFLLLSLLLFISTEKQNKLQADSHLPESTHRVAVIDPQKSRKSISGPI